MAKLWNKETLEPTTQSPYNATFSGLERVAKGARRNGTRWRSGPTNATASQRSSSVIQLSHLLSWASLKASDMATLMAKDLGSAKIKFSKTHLRCDIPCVNDNCIKCTVYIKKWQIWFEIYTRPEVVLCGTPSCMWLSGCSEPAPLSPSWQCGNLAQIVLNDAQWMFRTLFSCFFDVAVWANIPR